MYEKTKYTLDVEQIVSIVNEKTLEKTINFFKGMSTKAYEGFFFLLQLQ